MPYAYDITEADFDTAVLARSREVPVLVDFWAPWCGPCRSLKPLLEKLAGEYGGRFELAKLNSDEAPSVSARYAVRSIPAVKLFVDGEVVDEFTGALPEGPLRAFLDARLPDEAEKLRRQAATLADPMARAELLNQAADLSGGRPAIVLDLVAALLDEPAFAALFVRWLCLRTGHEPPVKRRVERPADEKLAALLKVARKAGVAGAALLDAAADELGIEKEDL